VNKPVALNIHPILALDSRFDFDTAKRFIELIRGDANSLMQFRALFESQEAKRRFDNLTSDERATKRRNYPGRLSELAPRLQRMNKSGYAIFVALNEFGGGGRKKENLVAAHVIPLDLDGAPLPDDWQVQPHWIQETSPGRYQCFFVIERTTDIVAVEDIARRLASHYGGDPAVCDATHVFRVPGFYHQKGKPFRVDVILENDFDPPRKLSDFYFLPALPPRKSLAPAGVGVLDEETAQLLLDALNALKFGNEESWRPFAMALHAASGGDEAVRDVFLDWCEDDPNPKYSRDNNQARWDSFRLDKDSMIGIGTLIKICRAHGVSEKTLHAVFNNESDDFDGELDPDFDMSEPKRHARIVKLNEVSADNIDLVFKLVNMGGKARIVYMGKSSIDKSVRVPEVWGVEDFRHALRNKYVQVESKTTKDGNELVAVKTMPLADWWLTRKDRYTYDGIIFDAAPPESEQDEINLWQGYGVGENPHGDWSLLRNHIRDVIASGDAASDAYVIKWLAWAVQNPTRHCEVALVLISAEKGTGKGFLGRSMCRLFGSHGLHISNRNHLVGKFNAHFMQVGFMFCDEVLWPGHKEDEGILKSLITEPVLLVEPKGINAYQAVNSLKIMMASNEPWVVPASGNDRRYAVFDVSTKHKQDHRYFAHISEQLEGGGLGAMLSDLRTMDLGTWHPRQEIPQTEALARQKELTAEPEVKLMGDILESGALPGKAGKPNRARATEFYDYFRKRAKLLHYWTDNQFIDFLEKLGAKRIRSNGTVWVFPTLQEARDRFRAARPWWPPFDPAAREWESEFRDVEGDDDD
jgi:hypothetical protein